MSAEVVLLTGFAPEDEPAPVQDAAPLMLASAPDVMSPKTLSEVLDGIAEATLAEWRTKDKGKRAEDMVGPPWRKLGGSVRYLKRDVLTWIDRLPAGMAS